MLDRFCWSWAPALDRPERSKEMFPVVSNVHCPSFLVASLLLVAMPGAPSSVLAPGNKFDWNMESDRI